MAEHYENFCLGDRLFYEAPAIAAEADFAIASRPAHEGWTRIHSGDWVNYMPDGADLPLQGWKIHASGLPGNAEEIIATVWDYCIPRRIAFKFLPSEHATVLSNSKSADRSMSGKLVTIYPVDEAVFHATLRELGERLAGQSGPYLLTDLRWGDGPLYVRYGAFLPQYRVDEAGSTELAIANERGELVPDDRRPVFKVQSWLTLPTFLEPHLAARQRAPITAMPYEIAEALHFSNAGGVYRGSDRNGRRLVLKEARPFAALDGRGADAITRLRRERDVLQALAGAKAVPALVDYFTFGDHEFLVREFVEGPTLNSLMVSRHPLVHAAATADEAKRYAEWAVAMLDRVEEAVSEIHARGVTIGDLNAANILVRDDGSPVVIDWEVAGSTGDDEHPALGTPAFYPAEARPGVEVDRYALACLRTYLFLPLTDLFRFDAEKPAQLAREIAQLFPVPEAFFAAAAPLIRRANGVEDQPPRPASIIFDGSTDDWLRARDSMVRAIAASATPRRDDRLFPGDIAQFQPNGGISLAHGAAGVLYAIHAVGAERQPAAEDWLVERAMRPEALARIGLYDGAAGVAYVLGRLGRRREANVLLADLLARLEENDLAGQPINLFGGLAGIGLAFLHFAATNADVSLTDTARRIGARVVEKLEIASRNTDPVSGGSGGHAGLMRGAAGPALFLLQLSDATGESDWLDAAASGLRQDLRRCLAVRETLQVNEGWRTLPYLASGGAGIGIVLDRYLARRADAEFAAASAAIGRAAEAPFYVQSGVFEGRAGMMLALAGRPARSPATNELLRRHIARLAWHALPFSGELAFPGDRLLRLSMDLATGTAGVMLAWGAATHSDPVGLPFLD